MERDKGLNVHSTWEQITPLCKREQIGPLSRDRWGGRTNRTHRDAS